MLKNTTNFSKEMFFPCVAVHVLQMRGIKQHNDVSNWSKFKVFMASESFHAAELWWTHYPPLAFSFDAVFWQDWHLVVSFGFLYSELLLSYCLILLFWQIKNIDPWTFVKFTQFAESQVYMFYLLNDYHSTNIFVQPLIVYWCWDVLWGTF